VLRHCEHAVAGKYVAAHVDTEPTVPDVLHMNRPVAERITGYPMATRSVPLARIQGWGCLPPNRGLRKWN
jgi:hypothetical protein